MRVNVIWARAFAHRFAQIFPLELSRKPVLVANVAMRPVADVSCRPGMVAEPEPNEDSEPRKPKDTEQQKDVDVAPPREEFAGFCLQINRIEREAEKRKAAEKEAREAAERETAERRASEAAQPNEDLEPTKSKVTENQPDVGLALPDVTSVGKFIKVVPPREEFAGKSISNPQVTTMATKDVDVAASAAPPAAG